MSSNRSFASSSRQTQSTKATSVSSKGKRSSAYDKDFEQNLIDHSVYVEGYEYTDDRSTPEPNDLVDVVQGMSDPRASLSPSRFSVSAFKNFKQANSRVISEGKVMADILPTIRGNAGIPSEGNLPFSNLASITDGTTVDAVPDLYDGSYPKEISKVVRQNLSKMITPTSHGRAPVAPNFFVEVKAPRGGADVAKRQACLDGAIGARAMHNLQNYGEDEPTYDGNAHAFSSTYHDGTLKIYAHHVTAPITEGEPPEYHMTQLKAYAVTSDRETFIQGAAAFRNARDLARQRREAAIRAANARASQAELAATAKHPGDTHGDNELYEPMIHSETSAWQDSHDDLQQQIAETCVEEYEDNSEASTTPHHHYASDESQDLGHDATPGTDNPSMSLVSSFSTSFNTDITRPKRSRQSFSSPTQGSRSSKSRSRFTTTQQPAVSPATIAEPKSSDSNVSYWVETYGHKEKIYLQSPEGQEIQTGEKVWGEESIYGAQ